MHWLDWTIVVVLLAFIIATALSTKKYMLSVADFLSANRCAGKYLLGVADGISGLGAVSIIALFGEQFYYLVNVFCNGVIEHRRFHRESVA